jgi:hypothetical protein
LAGIDIPVVALEQCLENLGSTAPGYGLDKKIRVQLENKVDIKERGLDSPDDADALALTFARKVVPKPEQKPLGPWTISAGDTFGWMA